MDYRINSEVKIPLRNVELKGEFIVPLKARAIIIFAHGSGSSRMSPRNKMVAKELHQHNFGTLLLDLLTEKEDLQSSNRFDISLLTKRLIGTTTWVEEQPTTKGCSIGYFGSSTGAAAALKAAAYLPQIEAVISRGGRPDLVMECLSNVESPTLLIVGSLDYDVLHKNQEAYKHLHCEKKIEVIDGATHLFEEHGMMKKVAALSAEWYEKNLHAILI